MNIIVSSIAGHSKTESVQHRRVLARLGHSVRWVSTPETMSRPDVQACAGLALRTSLKDVIRLSGPEPDLFLYVEPFGLIPEGIERATFPTASIPE